MSPEHLVDTGTDALLAAARNHRLTLIVADAGWGKSTFLRRLILATGAIELSLERTGRTPFGLARALLDGFAQRVPGVSGHELPRHAAPDSPGSPNQTTALAASVAAAAASVLDDIVVVIDDAELAAGDPLERFVEALVLHLPPAVHLVLACRRAPHLRIARLRASGDVLRIGPEELCLSEDDVRILDLPPEARPAVVEIARATGGWPLAIQLATDAVRRSGPLDRAALVDRLLAPDAVLFEYLAEEALASLDGAERDTVALAAHLPHLSVALLDELGRGDLTTAMHRLGSGGTFLERDVDPGRYQATLLGGEFARRVLPMPADTAARALEAYLRLGRVDAALDLCVRLGDGDLAARVVMAVRDHDRLIIHDNFEMVLRLAEKAGLDALAAERRGDLYVQRGEWDDALASYGRAAMLGDDGAACIARKRAEILYLQGRLDEAEAACRTARLDGSAPGDEAQVLAWLAAIRWVRGDIDGCGELLEPAEAAAAASGDDAALAAVHTARAMLEALRGDRRANDRWYRRALQHAVRAEDVVQIVRIRSSLGSHHLEQGEYREALAELDTAIELSELAGSDTFAAMAYANRADTYLRMGRLDDALHAGRQAQRIWDRLGSDLVDYALGHLGHVQLLRGQRAEALALFNEAVVRAESRGDVQGLVPGLIGLVRVLVDDDPEAAAAAADRAMAASSAVSKPHALVAAALVARRTGDMATAEQHCRDALDRARTHQDRPAIAEALLELAALQVPPDASIAGEALRLWEDLGNPIGAARASLLLATGAEGPERQRLLATAERQLYDAGAWVHLPEVRRLQSAAGHHGVAISTLGGFRVVRDGVTVEVGDWGSRKARDLLKLLVARRGAPVGRDEAAELLWPGEPDRSSRRLSVLLSTIRNVLDPGKSVGADHYVAADHDSMWLVREHVEVDVEQFLGEAAEGRRLLATDRSRGERLLNAAAARYLGGFCADDPYVDWAAGVRQLARHTFVDTAGLLATLADGRQDHAEAIRHRLRVLDVDPFDEPAHLGVVASLIAQRRHGEARRAYRAYCDRLAELDLDAAPFPA